MIDEYFDRWVDWLCEVVPAWAKPRALLFFGTAFGWRMRLYFGTAAQRLKGMLGQISNEDNIDRLMRETAEKSDDSIARVRGLMGKKEPDMIRLAAVGNCVLFTAPLLMLLIAALGAAQHGGMLALMAAALCLQWLCAAVECGYAPVCGGLRQRYLAATLLRTLSLSVMLVGYFTRYIAQGVPSNVVLQSAMIVTLSIHAILYLSLILLNTRQPLFLRALALVTGIMPALTAAGALALAVACLFSPWPTPLAGVLSAAGAVLAFLGDQLITIRNLGGIRLKYHTIWVCLLMTGGFLLMLLGAWTYAL